jgi:malonyl-CoA O-methyltransferase
MTDRIARYEEYAHVQRQSASDLVKFTCERVNGRQVRKIFEPGCGTGLYTRELLDAFPEAAVEGIDISEAMIRQARGLTADQRAYFRVADAEAIVFGKYDLITSNAAFQWFNSFDGAIRVMGLLLSGGGLLTFTYFGPQTFVELNQALLDTREDETGERTAASRFLCSRRVEASLSAVFSVVEVEQRIYCREYDDLAELLRSIRYTGAGGGGPRKGWTPGRLARVERAYLNRFGAIRATYQVFFCRAEGL